MNPTETAPGLVTQRFTPPLKLRDFKLIAFDMDSTLINIECVDEIADAAGRKAEVAAITEAAMRGEIADYKDSLRQRVALLKGVTVAHMEQVYTERLQLNPGATELVAACKAAGLKVLLVSGGRSDLVTERTVGHFLELAPHAQHVQLPQATHMVAGDDNDAFTDTLVHFLHEHFPHDLAAPTAAAHGDPR